MDLVGKASVTTQRWPHAFHDRSHRLRREGLEPASLKWLAEMELWRGLPARALELWTLSGRAGFKSSPAGGT